MKLKVRVNRNKAESMTRQITNQLTGLIETGVLTAGELLPSERTLADTLGVARNVVRRSYDYLTSGGHVESQGKKGRRVRAKASGKKSGATTASAKKSKTDGKATKKSGTKAGTVQTAAVSVRVGAKKRK